MAPIRVVLIYGLTLSLSEDVNGQLVEEAIGHYFREDSYTYRKQRYTADAEVSEKESHVSVTITLATETDDTESWSAAKAVRDLSDLLERGLADLTLHWGTYPERKIRHALSEQLHHPNAIVTVPLYGSDVEVILSSKAARRAHDAAIRETYPFFSDQQLHILAVEVHLLAGRLRISGPAAAAIGSGESYINATRRRSQPLESNPRRPVWAIASAAIALISVGMSFLTLSWIALALLAAVVVAVAGASIRVAPQFSARRTVTALGLAPILTLMAFALTYGTLGLTTPSAITVGGAHMHYLREPLLLALSLLTTAGIFDLALHGWVRSLAYLEMLLIASLAGGAAVIATRWISETADRFIGELQVERQQR